MENKILQACKIISSLGSDYDLYDWHKTCVEIMNLGLTIESLSQFVDSAPEETTLGTIENGNYSAAANYIYNFIFWNDKNMSFVKESSYLIDKFIKVVEAKN